MGEKQSEVEILKKAVLDLEARLLQERRSNERLELVVESATCGIVVSKPDGGIVLVNRTAETLFGYSREEFLNLAIEDLVPPGCRPIHPGHREDFQAHPEARQMGEGRDLHASRKDGTEFPAEISLTPMPAWDGMHFLATIVDISARKQAEAELHAYAEELERSNSELSSFASFASHDLQEPLRKIKTMGERLARMSGDVLSEKSRDYLSRMIDASERMHHLILNLLAFSRVSEGPLPFGIVDMNKLVEDVLSTLDIAIEESGSIVEVGALPAAEVDGSQFRLVFQNLIGNSLKFSRPRIPPRIEVTGRIVEGDLCEIEVKDNGIGFEAKYSEVIFDIFQRLHGRSRFEGNGVGLAICKKIVERHGGAISAVGKPGEGSEFRILLPRQQGRTRLGSSSPRKHER